MKKIIVLFIFLNFITFGAKAQIVYIDINFILNTSYVGKDLNSRINKIKSENLEKYNIIQNSLINKEKSIIAQQNIIDKKEFEKKLSILAIEVEKYRSDKKSSVDQINKIRIERTKEILKVLNPIITKYVDTNSISLVIPKKNIIIGKKKLDITDDIIKLLNNDIKKLNF